MSPSTTDRDFYERGVAPSSDIPEGDVWNVLGYELVSDEKYEELVLTVPDVQAGLKQALAEIEAWSKSLTEK